MVNNNVVDFAIGEDSDIIAFGCNRYLYKLDKDNGSAKYFDYNNIESKTNLIKKSDNNKHQFSNLTKDQITIACILSGCDYIENLKGMGLITALEFVKNIYNIEDVKNNLIKSKKFHEKFNEEY